MIVGYTALCALQGINLQRLEITTEGDIDLRGFFGLDSSVAAGYRELHSRVMIKGDGTEEQFQKNHQMVLATSPTLDNITRAVRVMPDWPSSTLGLATAAAARLSPGGPYAPLKRPGRRCLKRFTAISRQRLQQQLTRCRWRLPAKYSSRSRFATRLAR
jgi:hypothetical protein